MTTQPHRDRKYSVSSQNTNKTATNVSSWKKGKKKGGITEQ